MTGVDDRPVYIHEKRGELSLPPLAWHTVCVSVRVCNYVIMFDSGMVRICITYGVGLWPRERKAIVPGRLGRLYLSAAV